MSISLKKATLEDKGRFLELHNQAKGEFFVPVLDFEKELSEGPLFMIQKDGEAVGAISYEMQDDGSMYIASIVIDPAYRGQGIGKIAMLQVLEDAKVKKAWLVTHPDNAAAIGLYESIGFKISERKEDYYGAGQPRLILILEQK